MKIEEEGNVDAFICPLSFSYSYLKRKKKKDINCILKNACRKGWYLRLPIDKLYAFIIKWMHTILPKQLKD